MRVKSDTPKLDRAIAHTKAEMREHRRLGLPVAALAEHLRVLTLMRSARIMSYATAKAIIDAEAAKAAAKRRPRRAA